MNGDSKATAVMDRRVLRRGLAGVAATVGLAALAWAGAGIAGVPDGLPQSEDALVAAATVLYGLVLLGAGWAGRGGRDLLVITTLLGLGTSMFLAGPLGLGLLGPVTWGILVATVSLVVGLPAVVLTVIEDRVRAGPPSATGV